MNYIPNINFNLLSSLEYILILIIISLVVYIIYSFGSKSSKRGIQTVNFLDSLPFENDLNILSENIVKSVLKKFDFSTGSFFLINSSEKTLKNYLKEPVPDTYVQDIKNRIIQSLTESGIDSQSFLLDISTINDHETDNSQKKVLTDSIQVPIIVNEILVGFFCFTTSSYFKFSDPEILELFDGILKRLDSISKFFEEVQEGKDKFEDLINSINSPVCMLGKSFDLIYINPSFEKVFKLSSNENFNILDFAKKLPKNIQIEKTLQDIFIDGKVKSFENVSIQSFIFDITFFPVVKVNKIVAISILFQEVSKDFESEKMKQEFLAMMVHDLRSPLTVIKSGCDLIISRYKQLEEKKIKEILKNNINNVDSMLLLVSDLLDSYKIDLNKVQIFKEVSDINELISNIIKDHSPQYEAKGLELEADLDTKVKELAIDKMKFTQVMQNLLSNSMKYTEKGKVIVKTKQGKNEVIVEVIDTGIGIPDETKSKLFSRFTQLEGSIKSKFKGTGLGLSVVKGIVEAHHGKILVLDNKPHGSIFQIHLPVE